MTKAEERAEKLGLPRQVRQPELLEVLRVSRMTLWQWRQRGLFPAGKRVGGVVSWDLDEIKTWLPSRSAA